VPTGIECEVAWETVDYFAQLLHDLFKAAVAIEFEDDVLLVLISRRIIGRLRRGRFAKTASASGGISQHLKQLVFKRMEVFKKG